MLKVVTVNKVILEYNMHKVNLRKVGGSVMLALPPAILEMLDLKAGNPVAVRVKGRSLVVEPEKRPHYTLDELLAQCNPRAKRSTEDQEWLDAPPVGRELP
jgi:antitoxin ChpS